MANDLIPQASTELTAQVAGLLSGAGDDLAAPAILGEQRQPAQQERRVQKVEKPQDDILDPKVSSAADLSPIAINLERAKAINLQFTDQQNQDLMTMQQAIEQRWNECQRLLTIADQHVANGDYGTASYIRQEAGVAWAEVRPIREAAAGMQMVRDATLIAEFQKRLLAEFSWLASAKAVEGAVRWCCQTYNVSEQDVWNCGDMGVIIATCREYEQHARKQGRTLPRATVGEKVRAARGGKRQPVGSSEKVALVAELLKDIK